MASEEIGKTLKAHCTNCGGERNCEIAGHRLQRGDDGGYFHWRTDWYLLECRGCEHIFAQSVSSDSETYHQEYDHDGEIVHVHSETIRTWPAKFKRNRPDWFSANRIETDHQATVPLDLSLLELYGALDHDLNMLAAIGLRTSFDIASEILGIDASLPFQSKLTELVTKGFIKEHEREHLDILVEAGSASAHRGWKPSVDDLDTLMGILESFVYDCFVVPARRRFEADRIARVKAKVPPKAKAEKRPKKPDVIESPA